MKSMKPGRNDPCPCGSGKKYKHCCEGKVASLPQSPSPAEINPLTALYNAGHFAELESRARSLLYLYPTSGFVWELLGLSLQMQNKDALHAFQKAAEIMPVDAGAHYNLGFILKKLGRLDEAAASYRRALKIKPDYAEALSNLGNVFKELGQLDNAVASYRQAVKIRPNLAETHHNLGNALKGLGQLDEAVASYRRAIKFRPDSADAYSDLGAIMKDMGQYEGALDNYRRALGLRPASAEAHFNVGVALESLWRLDDAIASYRRAVEIKPDFATAFCNLASALKSQGRLSEAKECYRKAQESGFIGAWIGDALMLPAIMGTRQEMIESRAEFERNLAKLAAQKLSFNDPLMNAVETNFYLAYHGLNDRDVQIKVAKFYEQACPSLLYTAPHCSKPRSDASKIRVGFISKYLFSHSVSRCFSKIIESISVMERFEAALISSHPVDTNLYSGFVGKHVRLPYNPAQSRKMLAALELDILVYLDIGMEPLTYFLAFSRLARTQCVMAGHPVTTGISNMDYFLSTDLMEPDDADAHYSEKLVRFPMPPVYFHRPVLPVKFKSRYELGLPEGRHIYMCPMKMQKLHPDFDEAITRILELDDNGVVVLFEDLQFPSWKTALEKRFEKTIPSAVRLRIIFLPWLKENTDFVSAIAAADVVLDPFHFGIGSTAAVTCVTGTPLVTKAGEFMRGRVGAFYCKLLDLEECIADDTESYARIAVQIASDPSLRDTIHAKILKNNHTLYDDLRPADDLANFFCSLTDQLEKQP